jgi:hypothetical protein
VAGSVGKEFFVLFTFVVTGIENVLYIILHKREDGE